MTIKEMRTYLGIEKAVSRVEFSKRYNIPIRTLEDWEAGKRIPPSYVLELLERAIKFDKKEKELNTMTKFEIRKETREIPFKNRNEIKPGCVLGQSDLDEQLIKSFDTKEEALQELANYKSSIDELSGAAGKYYYVAEYFVQENEYNEDNELIAGGDIWEFSKMKIDLVDESDKVIATFDNYEEAAQALKDNSDAKISFN